VKSVVCENCRKQVKVPADNLKAGCVIGDFSIEKEIGAGGMARVFLARQLSLDRPVALKVLNQEYAQNKTYADHFLTEAKSAARLNHPNIVQAHAFGTDDGHLYYAMEYVDGDTLSGQINTETRMELDRALNVTQQVAEGLHAAWTEERLIHRDVKPENIIILEDGSAKVMDLGIAVRATEASQASVCGTPAYMAPEQFRVGDLDCRTDIYSLGTTLYHAIIGYPPFSSSSSSQLAQMHATASVLFPDSDVLFVPERARRLVTRMMAKHRNDRFADYEELLDEIVDIRRRLAPVAASIPSVHTVSIGKFRLPADVGSPETIVRRRERNQMEVAEARRQAIFRAEYATTHEQQPVLSTAHLAVITLLLSAAVAVLAGLIWQRNAQPTAYSLLLQTVIDQHDSLPPDEFIAEAQQVVTPPAGRSLRRHERDLLWGVRTRLGDAREAGLRQAEVNHRVKVAEAEQLLAQVSAAQAQLNESRLAAEAHVKALEVQAAEVAELTETLALQREEQESISAALSGLHEELAAAEQSYEALLFLELSVAFRAGSATSAKRLLQPREIDSEAILGLKQRLTEGLRAAALVTTAFAQARNSMPGSITELGTLLELDGRTLVFEGAAVGDDAEAVLVRRTLSALPAGVVLDLARSGNTYLDEEEDWIFAYHWGDLRTAYLLAPEDDEAALIDLSERCFAAELRSARQLALAGASRSLRALIHNASHRYSREQLEQLQELLALTVPGEIEQTPE